MNIINWFKNIFVVLKEAGKIKEYEKISSLTEKNAVLETDNKKLKDELEIKENLIPDGNVYWIMKDGKRDGPFCTCCHDSERKLIRLHKKPHLNSSYCPKCKTVVDKGEAQIFRPIDHVKNSAR